MCLRVGRAVFDETWQTLRTESALPRGAMEIKQATRIANAMLAIKNRAEPCKHGYALFFITNATYKVAFSLFVLFLRAVDEA